MKNPVFSFFQLLNPTRALRFAKDLNDQFGVKFTLLVFSNYFGIKGALRKFLDLGEFPYFRESGYGLSDYQKATALANLPWSIKGVAGLSSDLFPMFGYAKSSYLLLYSILGVISTLVLSIFEFNQTTHHFAIPAILFFCGQAQTSFCDILIEGKYADLMKRHPENRGNIISFSYFCISIGSLIPASSVGFIADSMDPRIIMAISVPFSLQFIPFILTGCCIDDKCLPTRNFRFDFYKAKKQAPIMLLATVMTLGGIGQAIVTVWGTSTHSFIYSISAAIILNLAAFLGLPIVVAILNLYLFLGQTLYINIGPVLEYYYTGNKDCSPNGPHFDYAFYISAIAIVTEFANIVGIWLFQAVFTHFTYRVIFWFSSLLRCFAALIDLIMVKNWNRAIGIPDEVMFLFGQGVVFRVVYMLDFLPFTLMIAKIVPKNVETTLFSLLAGFANYGGSISRYIGNYMTEAFGIYGSKEGPCNFDNLALLILVSNTLIPLTLIPLAFVCVPNKKVGENIADQTFEQSRYLFPQISQYNRLESE